MLKITPELMSALTNQDVVEVETNGDRIYWYTRHGGIARSNMSRELFNNKYEAWKVENKIEEK